MANFIPLKKYMIYLIEKLVDRYGVRGPFLDGGCGRGDVALHFAKKGWSGTAVDQSQDAVDVCRGTLADYSDVHVVCGNIDSAEGKYNAVFLLDVVEHVPDDRGLLASINKKMTPGGHFLLSVPMNPREWRWDDDYYGHLRRYTVGELKILLEEEGFDVLETWDCTFPVFWLMRRLYTRFFMPKVPDDKDYMERTKRSSLMDAWGGGVLARILNTNLWRPLFPLQAFFFKDSPRGFELIVLAQKKGLA